MAFSHLCGQRKKGKKNTVKSVKVKVQASRTEKRSFHLQ